VEGAAGRVGAVFEPPEPHALAQTLLEALDLAPDPATAGACRQRAEDYPIERCAERYEALYRELLA
jgi:glycosyltransferase involved in cell wall biosynthesis